MSRLRLIYRVLREELRAIGWRFGIDRPKEIGTFIRYTVVMDEVEMTRVSVRLLARLAHLASLGKLRITGGTPVWHEPARTGDPYDQVGSIGWKLRVQ